MPSEDRTTIALDAMEPRSAFRVEALIAAEDDADAQLWAYGDSSGDTAMLAMADHPTWIGRRHRH